MKEIRLSQHDELKFEFRLTRYPHLISDMHQI